MIGRSSTAYQAVAYNTWAKILHAPHEFRDENLHGLELTREKSKVRTKKKGRIFRPAAEIKSLEHHLAWRIFKYENRNAPSNHDQL